MTHIELPALVFMPHYAKDCLRPASSEREWQNVLIACGQRCFYCTQILVDSNVTKDHLVPICRGGCECVQNLVASCIVCNSMKKQLTVEEFLSARPGFAKTIGKFPTTVNFLEEQLLAKNNPVLTALRHLAEQKRMEPPRNTAAKIRQSFKKSPQGDPRTESESISWAWRNPA